MRRLNSFFILLIVFLQLNISANAQDWPTTLKNECDFKKNHPEWIWCDDFEIDRSSFYFEGQVNLTEFVGVADSKASAYVWEKGEKGAGGIRLAFGRNPDKYFSPVDEGIKNYREIYWRHFVMVPLDWGSQGADKLSRATILASRSWSQAMIAHVWSGKDPGPEAKQLYIDPARGTDVNGNLVTTKYNDFPNLKWLGKKLGTTTIFSKENFGQWFCVEAHVRLNSPGQNNGSFSLFINNELEVSRKDLNWIGEFNDYGINQIYLENWINAGAPKKQTRYFDNFIVSTAPIGCG